MFSDDLNVFHLARAAVSAGQMAGNRHDKFHASCLQRFHILLHSGVFPHAGIHRRCNQNGRTSRHHRGGKHIIRNAARHLADDVGRCGCDHKQIGTLSQRDMFNLPRLRTVKRIHRDRVAGERFKRQRSDKTTCILRHHNKNVDAPLLQQAQQLTCLINRNASGYAEDNAGFLRLT